MRRQLGIAALTIVVVALLVTLSGNPRTGQEVPAAGFCDSVRIFSRRWPTGDLGRIGVKRLLLV